MVVVSLLKSSNISHPKYVGEVFEAVGKRFNFGTSNPNVTTSWLIILAFGDSMFDGMLNTQHCFDTPPDVHNTFKKC